MTNKRQPRLRGIYPIFCGACERFANRGIGAPRCRGALKKSTISAKMVTEMRGADFVAVIRRI